jgi:hypothetical protein
LPTIIPSYVYSLFASVMVGAIIVCACGLSISNVKLQAEEQQLSAIANYVASESMQLLSNNPVDNLTETVQLDLPSSIGGQRYWVQIANDSARAWVEIGFGTVTELQAKRAFVTAVVSASGTFVSGSGVASLCSICDGANWHLIIQGGN